MVADLKELLLLGQLELKPAAKAATEPTKKVTTPAPPKPAAKAAATKATKKVTKPATPKPAAKAASSPAPESTRRKSPQEIYDRTGPKTDSTPKPGLAEARQRAQEAAVALINAQTKAGELASNIAAELKAQKKGKKRG
jgi:pyruvate/2-oxoglutarate dehydrogenase complex dihydrolipoamide acyltransferase (E2) component